MIFGNKLSITGLYWITVRRGGWLSEKLVNVVSGLPQGSVMSLICFFCTPWSFFPFWRISIIVLLITQLWFLLRHFQAIEL